MPRSSNGLSRVTASREAWGWTSVVSPRTNSRTRAARSSLVMDLLPAGNVPVLGRASTPLGHSGDDHRNLGGVHDCPTHRAQQHAGKPTAALAAHHH